MTSEAFKQGLTMLIGCYPNSKFDMNNMAMTKMWFENLKDLTDDQFKLATTMAIRTQEFFPSIATLRKLAVEAYSEKEIDADQAMGLVMRAISNYGYTRVEEAMASLPTKVRMAVQYMGGFKVICEAEDLGVLRGQMARTMAGINTRTKTEKAYGEGLIGIINNHQEVARLANEEILTKIEHKQNTPLEESEWQSETQRGIANVKDILNRSLNKRMFE